MAKFRIFVTVPHTFEYDVEADDTQEAEKKGLQSFLYKHKPVNQYHDPEYQNQGVKVRVKLMSYK